MNTVVLLNISLSRHSFVLDQCCHYSTMIKTSSKIALLRIEASLMLRHRGMAMSLSSLVDFYKKHAAGQHTEQTATAKVSLAKTLHLLNIYQMYCSLKQHSWPPVGR